MKQPQSGSFLALLSLLLVFTSSCMLGRLSDELEVFETDLATIEGSLSGDLPNGELAIVALLEVDSDGEHLARYSLSYTTGDFAFRGVEPGEYMLVAFNDRNADLIYQEGEPASGEQLLITTVGGGSYKDQDLQLDSSGRSALSMSLDMADRTELDFQQVSRGEVTTIENPRFTAENGSLGMWEPMKFLNEVGGGMYLLEPYSPEKIPVLFVHGLGGNPSEFTYLIENLDHEHFQAWVAFYPSHARMDTVANFVLDLTEGLHVEHGYEQLYVVGHSMGGLVGRAFIDKLAGGTPHGDAVSLLVTMCTPWGGSGAAKMGLKYSRVIAPAWVDLASDSPFLQGLGNKAIPEHIPFYLMFAYLDGESDDGTVSISSALHAPVQRKAKRVMGYESEHAGVLKSAAVSDELNRILKQTRESQQ